GTPQAATSISVKEPTITRNTTDLIATLIADLLTRGPGLAVTSRPDGPRTLRNPRLCKAEARLPVGVNRVAGVANAKSRAIAGRTSWHACFTARQPETPVGPHHLFDAHDLHAVTRHAETFRKILGRLSNGGRAMGRRLSRRV